MKLGSWQLSAVYLLLALASVQPAYAETPSEARMRRDVAILASDEFEGRGVTTHGIHRAAEFISQEFRLAGLKPGGKDGSYFQPFTMKGATQTGVSRIRLSGPQGQDIVLQQGAHFQPLGMSSPGNVDGPLVFAGYGISTPANAPSAQSYDDYQGLDASGKVVVVLRDTPRADNKEASFGGARRREYGSFTRKMQNASKHNAAAILFVNDRDAARDGDELLDFNFLAAGDTPVELPAFHVRRSVLDRLLQSAGGVGLSDVEKDIDGNLRPRSEPLTGWSAHLEANVKRSGIQGKNVIGILDGHGPLAHETVVVGAHYDHLGFGGPGSLASIKKPAIHHGADDNGSGTAALMELARRFAETPNRTGRRLVFVAFSGEESGLLGSVYYCKDPIVPLAETAAMVNMDMIGRLRADTQSRWAMVLSLLQPQVGVPLLTFVNAVDPTMKGLLDSKDRLIVYGTGSAKTFDRLIDQTNARHGFRLKKVASGRGPSDQDSFYVKKVPVFFFFTGEHADYHCPSDTADRINIAGMRRVADLVQDVVAALAQSPDRPEYVRVVEQQMARPEGNIPRLGIRPDYAHDGEGVMLSGVTDGGAAAKAGLKEGDCIVGLGGKPVKNLQGYMVLLSNHKIGEPVQLEVQRGGQKLTFKVVPE